VNQGTRSGGRRQLAAAYDRPGELVHIRLFVAILVAHRRCYRATG